jgi:DNA anti-recombination protein RmuC
MLSLMAVMARETWTDERLDDLKENVNQRFDSVDKRFAEVDKRFDKVDERFDKVEADMKAGFAEVNARINVGLNSVNARIDSMQRTMIICFSGMTASIVASIVGAILVTQL